jgi:hypothetical protein
MLLKKRDHGCWGRVLGFLLRPILVSARALGASGKQYCRKVGVCVCVCVRERERERGFLQRLGFSKEKGSLEILKRVSTEIRVQQGKGSLDIIKIKL